MKKTFILNVIGCLVSGAVAAQTTLPINSRTTGDFSVGDLTTNPATSGNLTVTGNINANTTNFGSPWAAGINNTAGNLNLLGDITFAGSNPWILHTPNSVNSTTLYVGPGTPTNWGLATEFMNTGDVAFKRDISLLRNLSVGQKMTIGNVSSSGTLGTNSMTLAVGGKIGAQLGVYVIAVGAAWPDYVFAPSYSLMPLQEVAQFIQTNKHLPEIPSAAQVQAEGLELASMQALLLKKVEELTLHLIRMQQENEALAKRVRQLEQE